MTDKKTQSELMTKTDSPEAQSGMNRTRRKALVASIAVAGAAGLPSQWKRPIVDHVLLPAHAQTSVNNIVTTSFTTTVVLPGILATCSPIALISTANTRITGTLFLYDFIVATIGLCNDGSGGTQTVLQSSSSSLVTGNTFSLFSSGSFSVARTGAFTSTITATATATSSATTTI
ncbi:MAG: hypothetical protein ACRBHB_14070 [Arenicella sp.]